MSCELTQVHRNLIDSVAKENGFHNYQIITNPASSKGGNFLGILTAVTVNDDDGKKLELILKAVYSDENSKTPSNALGDAYSREIYLYRNIFKEFRKFEEENNIIDPFSSIPKVYTSSELNENECILMENLKASGYQLWNKTLPMNPDHIKMVITEYAKFHATSLALSHKQPTLFAELTKNMKSNIFDKEDMWTDESLRVFAKTMTKDVYEAVADDQMLTDYVKKAENKFIEFMRDEWKKPEYLCVVDHGDCWCNNFMFKYQDPENTATPTNIRIIDWQLSRLNSPTSDFCYFFLIHSDQKALDDYDSYEEIYYNALCRRLIEFNCEPKEVFPYDRFVKHRNVFMFLHLFSSYTMLKIMLCDVEEAPDFSNVLEDINAMSKELDYNMTDREVYRERLKSVTDFMAKRKFDESE